MSQPKTIHLKDYQEPNFKIESVELHFDLFEEYVVVTNSMQMSRANPKAEALELNSVDLELEAISIDDIALSQEQYIYENSILTIPNTPEKFILKIKNRIYPQNNTKLEGLYRSGGIFCTQNEPEGFRYITPYLDRPDVMTVVTTTIEADKKLYPTLLGNGNPKRELFRELDGDRHSATWHDPHPKPMHLFAMVAGDLGSIADSFTTISGREIELNIYCDRGNESKCYHAMRSLKEAMVWDEEKYGREYDLDIFNIVAVDSFNFGAMENKGLNIFNSQALLADIDTAGDGKFRSIQGIVAHEYFHNWTGNRVGCKNWFQLTLKEGLTVFRDQCFSADLNSAELQRVKIARAIKEVQFVEDASPTAHPIQPKSYISMNNFYTSTVYSKGAEVIRMIHTLIGEEAYRKATDLYFETFDGKAVTTEDFLWAMEEASGYDLTQFRLWYHQSGTPTIEVKDEFKNEIYTIYISQIIPSTVDKKEQLPHYFPLKIGLIDPDGIEILEQTLIISKESQSFRFKDIKSRPYLSINRDFSAPIIVKQESVAHSFGMRYDSNSYTRYDATEQFAIETIERIMRGEEIDEKFIEAYGYLLDQEIEPAYKALLLGLPSSSTLMQRQKEVNYEPILDAKNKLSQTLAVRYKQKLLDLYHQYHDPKSEIDSKSMADRSLKNQILVRLSSLDTEEIITIAQEQYRDSISMSDRLLALGIIEDSEKHYSADEIQHFYKRYRDESLVINRYFSIRAYSQQNGVLERVKELQNDPIYDEKIPNIVYALLGGFVANYRYFHAKDGSGYKFITDKILELDQINTHISAGMARSFRLYNRMNSKNRELMRVELEKIVSTEGISSSLYEIVSKILKV